jgi:hypothetical protein
VLQDNHHRPGSKEFRRHALLKTGITVDDWRNEAIRDGLVEDGWGWLRTYIKRGVVALNLSSGRDAMVRLEQALG